MALDAIKTIQATAVLLRQEHFDEMGILRLMKLLYIADRESIAETGRAITGDKFAAMEHGPVLTNVLSIVKDEDSRSLEWRKYYKRDHYRIEMHTDPGIGRLSRYEIRKLEEVAMRFANSDVWDIVRYTHTFPEWVRNDPGTSSKVIPLEHVLEALGMEAEAEEILQGVREEEALQRSIESHHKHSSKATPSS